MLIRYTSMPPRVWLGAMPPLDHFMFDSSLLWGGTALAIQNFIAVDVPLPVCGIKSSANAQDAVEIVNADGSIDGIHPLDIETWPCTQFWGPARIWNAFPRTRLSLDDVIRVRLAADPALVRKIRRWFRENADDLLADQRYRRKGDFYFDDRLSRILAEIHHLKIPKAAGGAVP